MVSLLAMAASTRSGSFNQAVLDQAAAIATGMGAFIDSASFSEFDVPLYQSASADAKNLPHGAAHFLARLDKADGLLLASPEYNWSFPGNLKNLIDWVSLARPQAFQGKTCLLMSASSSVMGGVKGLLHLRQPLEAMGMFTYPTVYTLAMAHKELDSDGRISNPAHLTRLEAQVSAFVTMTGKLK